MTRARVARLARLEADPVARQARQDEARRAYLDGLTDRELDELHAALLRAQGHEDPEGEAARVRAQVQAMSTEDLRALLARLEGGDV